MNPRITQTLGGKEHYEELIAESSFRTRVAIPCIVQSYNSTQNTVECQPAIREEVIRDDNSTEYIQLPLLINVPVVFPNTGKYGIKFPINQGDEVLVIFADGAIDNFWLKGNIQNPVEARRHDLSDGIAIPCSLSLPKQYINMEAGINIAGNDVTIYYKDGTTQNNISTKSLVNRVTTLEDEVSNLKTRVTNLETAVTNMKTTYNSHTHQVTVGDTTYQTTGPSGRM